MRALMWILAAVPLAAQAQTPPAPKPAARPAGFAMCGMCHKVERGQPNGIGPNLWGVAGRKAAQVPGFAYSPALKKSGITWTRNELIAYVAKPQARVPGTRMVFAGQPDPKQQAAIADYLLGLK